MKLKELQNNVIEIGANPSDPKPIQSLNNENDIEIKVLKKKLNMPSSLYVQTLDLAFLREDKDSMYRELMSYKE